MRRPALAVLAVLAGLAAAATGAVLRSSGSDSQTVPTLADVAPASVQRLVVEVGGRRAGLTRHPGGWSAEPGTPPASTALVAGAEHQLFPMLGYRMLQADPADPQYGLTQPAGVLRVEDHDGRQIGVHLGAATFSGAGFYARLDGDAPRVYLVPRSTVDLLRSLTTGERTSSADALRDRADQYEADQAEAGREKEVPVYLRQVLDRGGQVPPPAP